MTLDIRPCSLCLSVSADTISRLKVSHGELCTHVKLFNGFRFCLSFVKLNAFVSRV